MLERNCIHLAIANVFELCNRYFGLRSKVATRGVCFKVILDMSLS